MPAKAVPVGNRVRCLRRDDSYGRCGFVANCTIGGRQPFEKTAFHEVYLDDDDITVASIDYLANELEDLNETVLE